MSLDSNKPEREKIPVGISSCLLGERVRYDGGHKGHSYIRGTLGEYFDFKPFCPEVSIGLGIPRKPIRLAHGQDQSIRCVSVDDDAEDFTGALVNCAQQQSSWQQELCGYILKKDSPSCGMERVKVWGKDSASKIGVGVYANEMMTRFPYLPVEEEGRLGDAILRENFIQRVFVLRRWHELIESGITVAKLVDFHARHKLILMSRGRVEYQALGQFVANLNHNTVETDSRLYIERLMAGLRKRATRKNHVNVLQHIQGYLKKFLDKDDKQELTEVIEVYRMGQVPLVVPVTLLNHFFRKHPNDYIANSWYMNPYPAEMSLQNSI